MKSDIDIGAPSIGRIYDYLLGGTQNFEADQRVAAMLLKVCPQAADVARLQRWFLHAVARRWADEGRAQVLDIGSGLPTQGHFNQYLSGKRVLFIDNDPLTVAHAQRLLAGEPTMSMMQRDARAPEALLEAAAQFFPASRELGIGLVALSYFLTDDELRRLARALHSFAAPGSALAMTYFMSPPPGGAAADFMATYMRLVNVKLYPRSSSEVADLISPWRVVEEETFERWLAMEPEAHEERLSNLIQGNGLIAVRD